MYKYVTTQVKENNKKLRRKEADARRRQRKKEMEISAKQSNVSDNTPVANSMAPNISHQPQLPKHNKAPEPEKKQS